MEHSTACRNFSQNRLFAKHGNHWQKIEQVISTLYAGFFVDNEEERKANRRKKIALNNVRYSKEPWESFYA